MSPVGPIFVLFLPKTGTNLLHPRPPPQSLNGSAASAVREERCPQGQVSVYHLVRYSADDRVIATIEWPEAIIDAEWVPARVYMIDI